MNKIIIVFILQFALAIPAYVESYTYGDSKLPTLVIRKMLSNKDFEKLNITLADYQKAYEKDVRNEDDLLDAYLAFSVNDLHYEALLNEWVKSHPNSYQSYLARASYFFNLGWKSRGTKWASETTDKQIEKMESYFSKANQDIEKVLIIKTDHIVPYYFLIHMYKASGGAGQVKAIVKKALEKCPDSFKIRSAYLLSITPRWGGTYEEMDEFATESQKSAFKNPRLKALKGYVFYDTGNMEKQSKNYGVALEFLNKALLFGDLALFYNERATIYEHLEKLDEALKDINLAIEMSSQNADFYSTRSRILSNKKMMQEALKDIEIANLLDPNDEYIIKLNKWIADKFMSSGHSKQKAKDFSGAIKDYTAAIQANPENSYSYYSRARVFVDKKDLSSAFTDLKKAIKLDPNVFDFYQLMDWLLTQKSDWGGIINYWSRYIALNPKNDRAYLERGGAYFRKGDLASAVADAKRAADLGNAKGQEMYDKLKSRAKK
ncbi:MAG: tetratricopeptide repeat protein [Nitrospirae bacterium]|nr:tetratricopeptide repeat protein [Nitrospirota bacterium]